MDGREDFIRLVFEHAVCDRRPFDLDRLIVALALRLASDNKLPPRSLLYDLATNDSHAELRLHEWLAGLVNELTQRGWLVFVVQPDGVHLVRPKRLMADEVIALLAQLEAALDESYPEVVDAVKAALAVVAVGCLADNSQPTSLFFVGPSGAGKWPALSFFCSDAGHIEVVEVTRRGASRAPR